MSLNTPHPYAGNPAAAPRAGARRPPLLLNGCLVALLTAIVVAGLMVLLTGVAIGRIGSWFDFNPFGVFAEPETTIDDRRADVIVQMQAMARLETMIFTVEKVIEAEKSGNAITDVFFGDKILLIAHGEVVAGVDLGKLDGSRVTVGDDNSISVALPPSEVFMARLDNDKTRVYDRDRGLLSRGDARLETKARQAAEASILNAACEQGILERAANEARTQVESLLRLLEFSRVTVTAPAGTCPASP